MLILLQQAALLLGTTLGAVTDAKTGYIYDWITIPMIIIGLLISIILQQWNNLIIGVGLFFILYLVYKLGKLGGGDVKLFVGIALLNPYNDFVFLATIMLFAAMSSMVFYSVYYGIKYFRKGINLEENKKSIFRAIILGAIVIVYFYSLTTMGFLSTLSAEIVIIPMLFGLVFIAFQNGITKNFFEAKVLMKNLEEDEVIAPERNLAKVIKLLKGKQLIGPNEIKLLKKAGIKSIYVLRKLPPFGPFILVGVLGAILQPNFIMLIFI
ncbi:MAG: A24 family peptidase [archaeon]|jgi:hypothetical protein